MKNIIFAFCSLFIVSNLCSQNYFNSLYHTTSFRDVIELDSGYLALGQEQSSTHRVIRFFKLNFEGDTISTNQYSDGIKLFFAMKMLKKNNQIYVFGAVRDSSTTNNSSIFLASFNLNQELNWIKRFGGNFYNQGLDFKNTNDNGFILAGSTAIDSLAYEDFYIVKTDSLGNEEWNKRYDTESISRISSIIQTSDNEYLMAGYKFRLPTQNVNGNYDFLILKADSVGNEIWQKSYGTNNNEASLFVKELNDKSILLSGSREGATFLIREGYLAKLNLNGDFFWEKFYNNESFIIFLSSVIENVDGSFVLSGISKNSDTEELGLIQKFDLFGNTSWQREYNINNDLPGLFYNIKPTIDGGYVLSGHSFDSTVTQRAWVVKVDCFGCDSTLCYYQDSVCDFYDCTLFPINSIFTSSTNLVDFNFNDSVTFVNNSLNTTNRVWNYGDGEVAYTDSAVSHIYAQTGTYNVQLIVFHGMCSDTLNQTVVVSDNIGLSENELSALISVYPNPSNGSFSIENKTGKELSLEITDALGKTVYFENLSKQFINSINLNLESGIYFVNLYDKENSFKQKIIISK